MNPIISLRPSPRILLAGLVGGAATASGIALTATSGWLIVRASERPVILTLLVAVVGVRAFGIARPALRYVERLISHDEALSVLAERRSQMYAALVPLTPARLGRRSRSSLLAGVVDDITDVVDAQVRVAVPVISGVLAGIMGALLAALLSPAVGLIVAALLAVVSGASYLGYLLEKRSQAELLAARGRVQQVSDLVARNSLELQAIGAQQDARLWLREAHDTWNAAVRRQARGRSLTAAAILLATGAATAAAAWVAIGVPSGPVAALLVVLPVALGDGLAPLAETMRALARAEGARARIATLLDQAPAVSAGGTGIPDLRGVWPTGGFGVENHRLAIPGGRSGPQVSTDGVQASWSGDRADVPPVTLSIEPGASLALVGANGAGKSTLLAILARHLDPTRGRYALAGQDVTGLDLAQTRALIALVDDEPHVFASTLRENLRLAATGAGDADLHDALRVAGLTDFVAGLDDGLDARIGAGARGLSGGERARLAIARAAVSRRPLVLLDEPVAHLDHATAVAVLSDLISAAAEQTVVMVSHRADGLEGFDAVAEISPGHPLSTTVCRRLVGETVQNDAGIVSTNE